MVKNPWTCSNRQMVQIAKEPVVVLQPDGVTIALWLPEGAADATWRRVFNRAAS